MRGPLQLSRRTLVSRPVVVRIIVGNRSSFIAVIGFGLGGQRVTRVFDVSSSNV